MSGLAQSNYTYRTDCTSVMPGPMSAPSIVAWSWSDVFSMAATSAWILRIRTRALDKIGLDVSAVASNMSYQIGWPSSKCFIPFLHCPIQSAQYEQMSSSKRERGSGSPRALRALGPPVPVAWDVATKGLSLGLCKDGQSNVLNCSTDSKSKSGCDVQTL